MHTANLVGGVVGTAIRDDEDLECAVSAIQDVEQSTQRVCNPRPLLIGRDDYGNRKTLRGGGHSVGV